MRLVALVAALMVAGCAGSTGSTSGSGSTGSSTELTWVDANGAVVAPVYSEYNRFAYLDAKGRVWQLNPETGKVAEFADGPILQMVYTASPCAGQQSPALMGGAGLSTDGSPLQPRIVFKVAAGGYGIRKDNANPTKFPSVFLPGVCSAGGAAFVFKQDQLDLFGDDQLPAFSNQAPFHQERR